jgi:hypothetical protein
MSDLNDTPQIITLETLQTFKDELTNNFGLKLNTTNSLIQLNNNDLFFENNTAKVINSAVFGSEHEVSEDADYPQNVLVAGFGNVVSNDNQVVFGGKYDKNDRRRKHSRKLRCLRFFRTGNYLPYHSLFPYGGACGRMVNSGEGKFVWNAHKSCANAIGKRRCRRITRRAFLRYARYHLYVQSGTSFDVAQYV